MKRASLLPPPSALYWRVTPLILTACICQWILGEIVAATPHDHLAVAIHAGTVFQQVFLAAVWVALGPLPIGWRISLGGAWLSLVAVSGLLPDDEAGNSFWLQASQWFLCLLVGLALSGIVMLCGLRLRYQALTAGAATDRQQFGIRGLFLFVCLIAVCLAFVRTTISEVISYYDENGLWILPLTISLQCLATLPLFFAALSPRYSLAAIGIGLLAIAGGTALESSFIAEATENSPSTYAWGAVALNSTGVIWTIAFAVTVRTSGYHLGVPQPRKNQVPELPQGSVPA